MSEKATTSGKRLPSVADIKSSSFWHKKKIPFERTKPHLRAARFGFIELHVGAGRPIDVESLNDPQMHAFKTKEAVEFATLEWVSWFNHQRLLEPIGYILPAEAEANYYRQLASQAATAAV